MSETRVDLRVEIMDICAKLDLPYHSVARLDIYPDRVEASVYERNESGRMFQRNGRAAERTVTTPIRS